MSKPLRTELQAERILKRLLNKWVKKLGLDSWEIVGELAHDEALDNDGWAPGFETAAECAAHWEYQRATIRFSLPWARKASPEELEDTAVHELMHVMLNELRREHKMANEERTSVMLTRAFLRTAGAA